MSSPHHRTLPALVLTVLVLAGACGGGGDDDRSAPPATTAADGDATSNDDATADDDASTAAVASRDADLDLPRSVTYAGVELEVTDATWSDATPATFLRDTPSRGGVELLYLELTTGFVDGFPGDDGFMPARHFSIETATGVRRAAQGVDFLAEVPVTTSSDSSVVLAFELTADELDGAVLTYDDGEHVAARLPLVHAVPEADYPLRVEVGEVAAPELATGCDPAVADVELAAIEWDVDGGVAVDGTKLARGRSSRALAEHRWLRAELAVTAQAGACGGTFANQETFRLLSDGKTLTPVNVYSLTLADGELAPMVFLFEVPVDAEEVTLEAGAAGASTATFEIELPDLP